MTDTPIKSYSAIVNSSALIGASSLMNIGLRIVRTKAIAILLGPTGIGLLGLYSAITDLACGIAGLGVSSSGVRQIAESVGSGDSQRIPRTVKTLARVALWSGALISLLLLILSKSVSRLTFGDDQHAVSVALLSLVVFFGTISAAQGALVQGMRRIADLARMNVLGAFYGTIFSIPIVYFYGEHGLVPSLVCVAAMGIITSWWYARKVRVKKIKLTVREILSESSELLKLGIVFMTTGFLAMGAAYLVRIIVLRTLGVEATGFYHAAWVLGGLYVGVILQAMGADFYPRLTAVSSNHPECNRLANEQAEVGLLLAVPGIIATLVAAPGVMLLFYSAKFGPAVDVLRWICLGSLVRVASWPMGYIVLAKGEGKIFFLLVVVTQSLMVGMVWLGVMCCGLEGTGIAFFGFDILNALCLYVAVRRLSGFQWSPANRRLMLLYGPLVLSVFAGWYILPRIVGMIYGSMIVLLVSVHSLKTLLALLPAGHLPIAVQRLFVLFRLVPDVVPAER